MPLTSFIGRQRDLAAVADLLAGDDVRLVTLLGPAGVGKTRLAIEVATAVADLFPDGARFIELASVLEEPLVIPTIARELGVWEAADRPVSELLLERLRDTRLLLVLDNLEQVSGAAIGLSELLSSCPGITMLVTSRILLRISGEHAYPVSPLAIPEGTLQPSVEALARVEAVRLFVERAGAAHAGFTLDDENMSAIAGICRRLDGVPLALELAAARIAHLPPKAILARLEPTLPLLTGGPTDAPVRHRSMRGAVAWSYDLLDEAGQRAAQRLSVFVGGCSLDAAAAVVLLDGGDDIDILDRVSALVDRSLVAQGEGPGGEPRYTMLEAIREFGLERLAASGDEPAVRRAHAGHYLDLVESAAPHLVGADQRAWMDRLEGELANIRVALTWRDESDDGQHGLRMTAALAMLWYVRNHLAEGTAMVDRALTESSDRPTAARAGALRAGGMMAFARGEYAAAAAALSASLPIAESHADDRGVALAWFWLALVAEYQGDEVTATAAYERADGLFKALGDGVWTALTVSALGDAACRRGDLAQAEALCDEGTRLARETGDKFVLWNTLQTRGNVELARNRWDKATLTHWEELSVALEIGDLRGVADGLAGLGAAAIGRRRADVGVRLLGAADRQLAEIGRAKLPGHAQFARAVGTARTMLGDAAFQSASDVGASLPLDEAIALARTTLPDAGPTTTSPDARPASHRLSRREVDVVRLLVQGRSDREIAAELFISRRTAAGHVASILRKLDAVSRTDAAVRAVRSGIV